MPSWCTEETQQLMQGVLKHGRGEWARILKDPELRFLPGRKPVSLRDKFEYMVRKYPQSKVNAKLIGHCSERQLQALSLPEPETGPRGINANHATSSITARPYNETQTEGVCQKSQSQRDFLQHPTPLYAWTPELPEWLNDEFSGSLSHDEAPAVALNEFGAVLGTSTSNSWLDMTDRYPDLGLGTDFHLETPFVSESGVNTDDFATMLQHPFCPPLELFSIPESVHWQ
ncbi:hypothetical protein BJ165DRAFT_1494791 [Panaeolus papilionaceus]|nr:hypothetical protein BJ165DRAFT_1494791 [Panaeolus papilionaceus]